MKIGQWVTTKYMGKHACVGFITAIYPDFKRCKLRVTHCENHPQMKWLEIAFDDVIDSSNDYSAEELDSLIDLALATYDEGWFQELTNKRLRMINPF
ncbi:MAG: hypothetical protein ABF868_05585 [Sporolactobacillus sp.]